MIEIRAASLARIAIGTPMSYLARNDYKTDAWKAKRHCRS
jgi:hypothetical protein